jgi:hypothetical protein
MQIFYRLKRGWTLLKFMWVGLGSLILYSSVQSGQIGGIVLGGLLLVLALFTDGICCAGGACYIPDSKSDRSVKQENIEYEELGSK